MLASTFSLLLIVLIGNGALAFEPPIDRFERDIEAFESADSLKPPPPGCTLFIGSSTFQHWHTLEDQFKYFRAINRGFGGSTIPEINHYEDRAALNYKPARIVFYAGTNDIAEGHSGEQVYRDFVKFCTHAKEILPNVQIFFISMSVAPSRLRWQREYETGNKLIKEFCAREKNMHYIDVLSVMRDENGELKRDYFLLDRLHMTPAGYAAWTPIIRDALKQSFAKNSN